jgi:hypothetical protein
MLYNELQIMNEGSCDAPSESRHDVEIMHSSAEVSCNLAYVHICVNGHFLYRSLLHVLSDPTSLNTHADVDTVLEDVVQCWPLRQYAGVENTRR